MTQWLLRPSASSWLLPIFLLSAAPVLILLALTVPPGEVPDEVAHILRADSVRHGEIAGFRRPRLDEQGDPALDAAVHADLALFAAGFTFTPATTRLGKQMTGSLLAAQLQMPWIGRLDPVSVPNTAVYPPVFYSPAALGLQLARAFRQGPFVAILFARMVNAAVYLGLAAAAIHLTRRGRGILFAILCLPMSLSLAASVNQDGLIIACAALSGALLTRLDRQSWWWGLGLLAAACMAKPNLLAMTPIVALTVPGGLRRHTRQAAAGFALAALPGLVWTAVMARFVAVPFIKGRAELAGPLWAGPAGTLFPATNPGEQLRILLESPFRLLSLPAATIRLQGHWLWREAIGVIGALDVVLPSRLYLVWLWVLVAAGLAGFLAEPGRLDQTSRRSAVAALLCAAASVWCIFILQYLSWTRVGEAFISGVQGRYLLPVAAIALPLMTVPFLRIPGAATMRVVLQAPAAALALAGLAIMPLVILGAYYVR